MSGISIYQKTALFLAALGAGVAACQPLEVKPTTDGTNVDNNRAGLVEDPADTRPFIAQSGEIVLTPATPGLLEKAPYYSEFDIEVTDTPEPYVPDSYITYAQARGLEVPSNISPEVDIQFRAFYNYIFNQQFEIPNIDGTVTTGSLLSASNPNINIRIAPDGTPYVEGTGLDNDPAFGGGDHHFYMIWDPSIGKIASLRISKLISSAHIHGFGVYTAESADGKKYFYDPVINEWVETSPIASSTPTVAPEAAITTVTATSTPTATQLPASTPAATTVATPSASPTSPNESVEIDGFDYGVPGIEGPVTVSLLQTLEDPEAASRIDPNSVHVISKEAQNGFTMVSVYPAYIGGLKIYAAEVTIDRVVYPTEFADVIIFYQNESGIVVTAVVRVWNGFSTNTGNHKVTELADFMGDPLIITTASDFEAPMSTADLVMGASRAGESSDNVLEHFQVGGDGLALGWTYNIRRY